MLPRVRPASTLLMIWQVALSGLLCITSQVIAKDERAADLSDIWAVCRVRRTNIKHPARRASKT